MQPEEITPVEADQRHRTWRAVSIVVIALFAVSCYLYRVFNPNYPVVYNDIREHFKYGSIGTEPMNGVPYWIWKVLPEMFPEKLPGPGPGYASLGFLYEPGRDLPIGMARRRVYLDRVGLNCAVCHTGTLRETPSSPRRIILGMPANNLDLQAYFRFLAACVSDGRFTADNVLLAIQTHTRLDPLERLAYRAAVWETREVVLQRKQLISFMDSRPDWGPGRVDTFNPYKTVQFRFPMDHDATIGTTDLPSIWNQKPREGMQLHWDGNNTSLEERNKSAALGGGVTPVSVDLAAMKRIEDWLRDELQPPPYPYAVDDNLARQGEALYQAHCASCHAFGSAYVGKVTPIAEIGTDPHRLDSFTYEFAANMGTLFAGYPYRFTHFRKTQGYANMPLDGVWLRAPYLHNGSVPTLRDLLEPPENRPKVFYRGYDVYDSHKAGFVSDVPEENGRKYFRYDTAVPGNGNGGHLYGTKLKDAEKAALVEYMKKL
ncbi:MAG TPA: c-type cytochrome [Bryobacteraceae bacterium]|nr:c-type cytochrome [Bryobacteraceae bacterium]